MSSGTTDKQSSRRAVVAGGGVMGLTSAIRLMETGWRVDVVAEHFFGEGKTTSDVPSAFWEPFLAEPADKVERWSRDSLRKFLELAGQPIPSEGDLDTSFGKWASEVPQGGFFANGRPSESTAKIPASDAGIRTLGGFELFREETEIPAKHPGWIKYVPHEDRHRSKGDEIPTGFVAALYYQSLMVETPIFAQWLNERVRALGARLMHGKFASLTEACQLASADLPDLIVNCTGLGAKTLVNDDAMLPVRGQLIRIIPKQDVLYHYVYQNDDGMAYVLPREDCVIVGGTTDAGNWNVAVDSVARQGILDRCEAALPGLTKDAEIHSDGVGLRPNRRGGIRVELEENCAYSPMRGNKRVPVVHNYGHAGAGHTLCWGCAEEVLLLIKQRQPAARL